MISGMGPVASGVTVNVETRSSKINGVMRYILIRYTSAYEDGREMIFVVTHPMSDQSTSVLSHDTVEKTGPTRIINPRMT
jgi:hypothetical protein